MGIPLYFKTISEKYSDIVISNINGNNMLFLDLNCAIHPCCRNFLKTVENYNSIYQEDYERKMINAVLRYIEKLVNFADADFVFISIDGVAPKAKMNQQRVRRFKTLKEKEDINAIKKDLKIPIQKTWDTNAISPGTHFMEKLSASIKKTIDESKFYKTKHVIFSNSNVPGEGEHKILKYIRENTIDENKNIVIYGLDADLIMLSMVSEKENCYLLRESVEFGITDYDRLLYLSIDELKESILCDFREKFLNIDPTFSQNPQRYTYENGFIKDYLFICFLLGNDFLPHIPSLNLRNKGLDVLINCYLECLNTMGHSLINKKKISNEFLLLLFRKLSSQEINLAKKYYNSRKRFRYLNKDFDNEFDRRVEYLRNLPSLDKNVKEIEASINMGEDYWEQRYYNETMNIRGQKDIDNFCDDYFKTLKWTYLYYFDECPSYYWSCNYSYGPCLIDLYNYIKNKKGFDINNIKFSKKPIPSPLVQLLTILPPESSSLIPDSIRSIFTDKNSPLIMYYPKKYKLEMLYKKYYWMCEPSLPIVDLEYVKDVVSNLSIPNKYKKRFTKQRNYVKEVCLK